MNNIEIRDEIYRNIHNMKPSWWMEWGVSMVALIIILLFTLSYFIQYSETVTAEVRISSKIPSVTIPSKLNSPLTSIKVHDNEQVEKDEWLVIFQNTANYEDILSVKQLASKHKSFEALLNLYENEKNTEYILGSVQGNWNELLGFIREYYEIVREGKYDKKINMHKAEILMLEQREASLSGIIELNTNVSEIVKEDFSINTTLHDKAVISNTDFNHKKREYLEIQKTFENERMTLNSIAFQILQVQNNIQSLKDSKREDIERLSLQIHKSVDQLHSSIIVWEETYVIKAPITGKVNYLLPLKENQYISQGTPLITITPGRMEYIALVKIPLEGAGKIAYGQEVNIKLADYPYQEYGMLKGKIEKIASVANEDHYQGQINLTNGNFTSYKKNITINQNAKGVAEIITKKRSLLSRIFDKVLYLFYR